ncbi:MAG: Major facilitator superfamily 1 transporter [Verrucomicrobia bacterium]|nr:Major facilitator superfamily 1 transporter [Verrucomicrobiota bacterium]
MKRVGRRLMPLLVLLLLVAFIDRQNVGFAKLTMLVDTGMSEAVYALGASLFFVGYLIFEIPSTLALHRYGARAWIGRIIFTWGLATVLLGFTANVGMFYFLRFMLGAAEAGFYPGVLYYLTLWFPQSHRARVLAIFTLGSALGNMSGAMISGPLLDLNGALGLAGWQWVFIGTGVPAIALTAVVFAFLPSSPADAKFLSDEEKAMIATALARDTDSAKPAHGNPLACLADPRVFGFALVYSMLAIAHYGATYWMPTVVKGFGVTASVNGMLNMIPWGLAACMLLLIPRRLRSDLAVLKAVSVIGFIGMTAFLASILLPENWQRFTALCIGAPCISLMYPCFWTLPPRFFSGARAAASLAAINSIGNLGGFLGQNLMPRVKEWSGTTIGAMFVPAAGLMGLSLAAFTAFLIFRRRAVAHSVRTNQV